jgi:hypothetical protein
MIISPSIFERLCLRFKAGDDATSIGEPLMNTVTVPEVGEAPPAEVAPQEVVAQDSSSKIGDQICISTGML